MDDMQRIPVTLVVERESAELERYLLALNPLFNVEEIKEIILGLVAHLTKDARSIKLAVSAPIAPDKLTMIPDSILPLPTKSIFTSHDVVLHAILGNKKKAPTTDKKTKEVQAHLKAFIQGKLQPFPENAAALRDYVDVARELLKATPPKVADSVLTGVHSRLTALTKAEHDFKDADSVKAMQREVADVFAQLFPESARKPHPKAPGEPQPPSAKKRPEPATPAGADDAADDDDDAPVAKKPKPVDSSTSKKPKKDDADVKKERKDDKKPAPSPSSAKPAKPTKPVAAAAPLPPPSQSKPTHAPAKHKAKESSTESSSSSTSSSDDDDDNNNNAPPTTKSKPLSAAKPVPAPSTHVDSSTESSESDAPPPPKTAEKHGNIYKKKPKA